MNLPYIWIPAREDAYRSRRGPGIQSVILHSTDGRCAGDLSTLQGNDGQHLVSVHFYVTRDGAMYHLVDTSMCAFHAGIVTDPRYSNDCSLGIEHEHFDGQEDWPEAQIRTTAALYVWMQSQYPNIEVAHHAAVACDLQGRLGRKVDPVDWPSDTFWQYVADLNGQTITLSQK